MGSVDVVIIGSGDHIDRDCDGRQSGEHITTEDLSFCRSNALAEMRQLDPQSSKERKMCWDAVEGFLSTRRIYGVAQIGLPSTT